MLFPGVKSLVDDDLATWGLSDLKPLAEVPLTSKFGAAQKKVRRVGTSQHSDIHNAYAVAMKIESLPR